MCGIVACYSKGTVDQTTVSRMIEKLRHRGPDAIGTYFHEHGKMALGHTRLSVIDLSDAANQPFHSNDGRYVTIFNGEIFNYRTLREELQKKHNIDFRTHSDTEVITEGFSIWGTNLPLRLQGMFSIVIVDKVEEKMMVFRDRVGKKPLYYYKSDTLIAFASEIKSLLVHPQIQNNGLQHRAVNHFLHLGYIPACDTIYKNIFKFPAGYFAEIGASLGDFQPTAYWSIGESIAGPRVTHRTEAKTKLRELLHDAVSSRLITDVPLGSFLSGGIDSSLVTAVASSLTPGRLKTFSIGFEEDRFDESRYAIAVASSLGTVHHNYILKEKEAIEMMPVYLRHFDEPFADTSAIPTMLVSRLARQEVTVALTGDGGDELFQGYGAYNWANRLRSPFTRMVFGMAGKLLSMTGNSRLHRISELVKPNTFGIRSHIFSQEQYFFSQREIRDNLMVDSFGFDAFEYHDDEVNDADLTAGEKQALFDLRYYLPDDLLVKVDRASMYYGLECRSPLLDYRLVEYAFRLAPMLKKNRSETKVILRDILRDYLPDALINRPKRGFSVPLSRWMTGGLRDLVEAYTDSNLIKGAGFVDAEFTEKLKDKYFGGMDYLYNRIWLLFVLHKWWKENS